jgi:hypothetical protein
MPELVARRPAVAAFRAWLLGEGERVRDAAAAVLV